MGNDLPNRLINDLRAELHGASDYVHGILSQIEANLETGAPCFHDQRFHRTNVNKFCESMGELLFLNRDKNVSIEDAFREIYENGNHTASMFDGLIFLIANKQTQKAEFTRTINVSARSVCSSEFWDIVNPVLLEEADPGRFVFEIVEYGGGFSPKEEEIAIIRSAYERNCRFALDDVSSSDDERISVFAPFCEILKIDGNAYIDASNKPGMLRNLCSDIRISFALAAFCENGNDILAVKPLTVLAEFVGRDDNPQDLHEKGINLMQGRDLC